MCSTCYLQTVDNTEKDSWFSGRLIIEGLCVLQFCPTLFSMTSSSYVLSDQVVLFQINKSCCGDRDLGGWFNAAYTTSKSVLQTNLQVITFLLRNNLKRVGDRCKAEHENQWCNFQGITRAGLGARDREEYGVIVISYQLSCQLRNSLEALRLRVFSRWFGWSSESFMRTNGTLTGTPRK